MAAPDAIGFHAYDSAAWRRIDIPEYYTSGVWNPISRGYVYTGGVWKTIFVSALTEINISAKSIYSGDTSDSPWDTDAIYGLRADGRAQKTTFAEGTVEYPGQWKLFEYGRAAEVRYDIISGVGGTFSTSPAMTEGVYYSIDTLRQYILNHTASGFVSRTILITLRNVASPTFTKSATITLNVENGTL